jgi:hypothetical protein
VEYENNENGTGPCCAKSCFTLFEVLKLWYVSYVYVRTRTYK